MLIPTIIDGQADVVDFKRKAVAAVIIGLLCVFTIDILTVFPWEITVSPDLSGPPERSCSWAVSVGDEFYFNASANFEGWMAGDSISFSDLLVVANESVKATMWRLRPSIGDSDCYQIEYVNYVMFTVTFANGSELPFGTKNALEHLISRHFLPIGGWEYMDWLFPDTVEELEDYHSFRWSTYLSRLYDAHFFFGYDYLYIDGGHKWGGYIDLATGIPFSIFASQFYAPYSRQLFNLTLVV